MMVENACCKEHWHAHVMQCSIHVVMLLLLCLHSTKKGGNYTRTKHQIFSSLPWHTIKFFTESEIMAKSTIELLPSDNIEDNWKRWVFTVSATTKLPCLVRLYMRKCTGLQYFLTEPVFCTWLNRWAYNIPLSNQFVLACIMCIM